MLAARLNFFPNSLLDMTMCNIWNNVLGIGNCTKTMALGELVTQSWLFLRISRQLIGHIRTRGPESSDPYFSFERWEDELLV